MKLEMQVSDTAVKQAVDKLVSDRLEKIIKDELGNFVDGHLAKKKLLGKTPPDMADLIDRRLKMLVQTEVAKQTRDLKYIVADIFERKVNAQVSRLLAAQAKKLKLQMLQESKDLS